MARSEIDIAGTFERPAFRHNKLYAYESCQTKLLESVRNVLEGIADSQMLQCDVRVDIRRMRIALEKIARNTPVRRKIKKNDR